MCITHLHWSLLYIFPRALQRYPRCMTISTVYYYHCRWTCPLSALSFMDAILTLSTLTPRQMFLCPSCSVSILEQHPHSHILERPPVLSIITCCYETPRFVGLETLCHVYLPISAYTQAIHRTCWHYRFDAKPDKQQHRIICVLTSDIRHSHLRKPHPSPFVIWVSLISTP